MFKKLKQIIAFLMMTALLLTGLPITSITLADDVAVQASAEPQVEAPADAKAQAPAQTPAVPDANAQAPAAPDANAQAPATPAANAQAPAAKTVLQDADYSESPVPSDTGIPYSAADVQGSASPEEGMLLLTQNAGLTYEAASEVASHVFFSPMLAGPAEANPLPRAADGNQVDSITAVWITKDTVDSENPEPDNENLLYLHPNVTNPMTAKLQINYSLSGEYNYEPGTISITIPAQIFRDKDGNLMGGMVLPYSEDPSTNANFSLRLEGDHYVITNTKRLSAAVKGYMQFGITNIIPYEILDMSVSDAFQAKIEVVTAHGSLIGASSNKLTAQINTEAQVRDAVKSSYTNPEIVLAKDIPMKNRIDGVEKYVKIGWYAFATITASGSYNLIVRDTMANEYQGTIKGFKDDDETKRINEVTFENLHASGQTSYFYYETYYPLNQFEQDKDYEFHNQVEFILSEVDHPNDPAYRTSSDDPAQIMFSWSEPKWQGPEPGYGLIKNGNDGKAANNMTRHISKNKTRNDLLLDDNNFYGIYPTALNDLEDQKATDISYTINTYANVLYNTYVEDPADDNSVRKIANYFKNDITVISSDKEVRFGSKNPVVLTPKTDYVFKSIEFAGDPVVESVILHNVNEDGTIDTTKSDDAKFLFVQDKEKSHWPEIKLQIQRGGAWEDWATADWKTGTLRVRPKTGDPTANPVVKVPEDTENFRTLVVLGSDAENRIATIAYDVRPVITLQPTEKISPIVADAFEKMNAPSLNVSNDAFMQAFKDYGTDRQMNVMGSDQILSEGRDSLRGYTTDVEVMPYKTAVFNENNDVDYKNRFATIHYQARVEERTVIHEKKTYEQAVKDGRITSETSGIWYDLLPAGAEPLINTIKLRENDDILDVQVIPNYQNSKRNLLIVKVRLTNTPETYTKGGMVYYEDVPRISFDARYDFDSEAVFGKEIHNVIAFESGNDHLGDVADYSGEPDDPYKKNHTATIDAFVSDAEKDLMKNLDPERDDPSFVYAGVSVTITRLLAAMTGLSKEVQVNNTGVWTTGTWPETLKEGEDGDNEYNTVWSGGIYKYRLRVESKSDSVTSNMILYDVLENFYPSESNHHAGDNENSPRWEGTLLKNGVDVDHLKSLGCEPVVYYSTVQKNVIAIEKTTDSENLALNEKYGDLTNASVWTKASEYTDDMAKVTAIAIDARKKADGDPFKLFPGQLATVDVSMLSPSVLDDRSGAAEAIRNHAHAYNNIYLYASSYNDESELYHDSDLIRQDYTKVAIKAYEIEISKQWSDDNDRDHIRPDSAEVTLYQDGKPVMLIQNGNQIPYTKTLNAQNEFHEVFSGIPVVNPETGVPYHYTFQETDIPGYRPSFRIQGNKVVLTNIHNPERVSVSGVKTWVGDEGHEDSRPDHITVKLYADGKYLTEMQVRAPWEYSFDNLYKYQDGKEIEYTIEEDLNGVGSYHSEVQGANIVNTYHPYGNLEVKKIIENTTPKAEEKSFPLTFTFTRHMFDEVIPVFDAFSFRILDENGVEIPADPNNAEDTRTVKTGESISIKGGQTIRFTDLPENLHYSIEEGQVSGFTLQSASNLEGEIIPNQTTKADLTNVYEATGEFVLPARKTLTGRELDRSRFQFELIDEDENNTVIRTASNAAADAVDYTDETKTTVASSSAPVNFGTIRYTQNDIGIHHYLIREVDTEKAGYTYDPALYHATVNVSDNGTGVLDIQASYSKEGTGETNNVSFTNAYEANGSVSLIAWKDLKGRKATDGEFTFNLCDASGQLLKTATNDADGTIRFDAIEYDQTDIGKTYYYMIKEQSGSDPAVNYDASVYGFKVEITDNGDGTLSIQQTKAQPVFDTEDPEKVISWNTEDAPLPVFENSLKPGSLSVSKHVTDADDANPAQEFRFKIRFIGEDAPTELNYRLEEITASGNSTADDHTSSDQPVAQTGSVEIPERQMKTASASSLSWFEKLLGVTEVQAAEGDSDEPKTLPASGTFYGVSWQITESGDLTLGETNKTQTLQSDHTNDWPWLEYYKQVKSLKINGTVKASGNLRNMFRDLGRFDNDTVVGTFNLEGLDTTGAYDVSAMFYRISASELILGSSFNTSSVTEMSDTFSNCTKLKTLDISGLDTRNVQKMYFLFAYDNWLETIKFGKNFDTSNVGLNGKDNGLQGLFRSCTSLKTLDFSECNFNTGNVPSLKGLFAGCEKLKTIILSKRDANGDPVFDTGRIKDFSEMFDGCSELTEIEFGDGFDTSNATTMAKMFQNCAKLEELDISHFNTANVTDMNSMFNGCQALQSLEIGNHFDTSNVTNMRQMFRYCKSLTELVLKENFNTGNVTDMERMFSHCEKLAVLTLPDSFNTGKVTNTTHMFCNCLELTSLTLGANFNTQSVTDMQQMFYNCKSLQELDLGEKFDTSSVTTTIRRNKEGEISYQSGGMEYLFGDCLSLKRLNLGGNFNTSNVSSMDHMFNNCSSLSELDLGEQFNTEHVTNMESMFYNCSSLSVLDLGEQFYTTNVTNMDHMFRGISSVTELDLGDHFDTSKVTNMHSMFKSATNLEKLDLGPSFTVGTDVETTDFFLNDKNLKWVSIPAGFRFNKNSILPNPSTKTPYTGKWTKEDESLLDSVTAETVKDWFNQGNGDAPGVWVWEENPTKFALLFDANGGAGSMPFVKIHADLDNVIPKNTFIRFGYEFDGWETTYDDKTYTYADGAIIPKNTFPIGAKVTLKAQWKEKSTNVEIKDGEGEFTLHANEKAVFENLPAGTAYQVYEETPDGWVLVSQSGTSGTIASLTESKADFTNKYQPTITTAQFSGTKTLDGEAASAGAFSFALFEGEEQIGEAVETREGGLFQFPVITYDASMVGTHTYTIREVIDASKETINFDEHIETVKVEVKQDEDGGLHSETTYDKDGIVFENSTKPGSLKIQKVGVNASDVNKDDVFTFTVHLMQANGTPISDSAALQMQTGNGAKLPVSHTAGVFTATCKAGESILITGIPAGSTYYVEEERLPSGWTLTSADAANGSIAANQTAETTFTNTYSAQGTIVLNAHKQLVGATPDAGAFTFELLNAEKTKVLQTVTNKAVDDDATIQVDNGGSPVTVANPWVGTAPVTFDEIAFTQADVGTTKTYYIRETNKTNDKITYDPKEVKVTVSIADAGKGLLSVTAAYDDAQDEPLFVNEMKDGRLSIRKEIQNATASAADTAFPFRFALTDASGKKITGEYDITITHADPKEAETTETWKTEEALNLKGGDMVTVSGLPHGASYQITETTGNGWTQVGKTGDSGRIEAGETAESTFTNSYHAEGEVRIEADKTFVGGDLTEHPFNFELLDDTMTPIASAQTDKDGKIKFDPIHYDNAKDGQTLTYYIHEIADENDPSVRYDSFYRKVTVQVSDNGDGTMSCEASYLDGNAVTNYALKNLSVHKNVTGNYASKSTAFRFTVSFDAEGKPFNPVTWTKGNESGTISAEGEFAFTLKHDETISFAGITYGTKYEVVEEDANQDGYLTTAEGDLSGSLTEDKAVMFTNNREMNVPTARRFGILGGIILILFALSGFGILMLLRVRRRKES